MILTITLNPAVDMSYQLDQLAINTVNRVDDVSKTAGGKGLNVTRILRQLNEDVTASGFLGGSLGDFIKSEVKSIGVHDYFVPISGQTRNCIAILHEDKQTEILENGPTITKSEGEAFLTSFASYIEHVKFVTISGSLPKGLPSNFYVQLLKIAANNKTPVLLDVNGSASSVVLDSQYKPFLIKPNEQEFADVLGLKSVNEQQIITAIKTEPFTDIPLVVVTLGQNGAIVKYKKSIYRVKVPTIKTINAVGSGDAVIAGFASGLSREMENKALVKYGLAMGVLNAMEVKTGHINPNKLDVIIGNMSIEKIN